MTEAPTTCSYDGCAEDVSEPGQTLCRTHERKIGYRIRWQNTAPLTTGETRRIWQRTELEPTFAGRRVHIEAFIGGDIRWVPSAQAFARQLFTDCGHQRREHGEEAGYIEAYAADDTRVVFAWRDK